MSDINCSACEELRTEASAFATNGTTTAVCNSLKNNTGLSTSNGHDNEMDLADAIDCLIGRMDDELEAYDQCDWKDFMHKYIPNNYEMLKAMLCSDSGQWSNITRMWCWLNNLATTPQTHAIRAFDDEGHPIRHFRAVDGITVGGGDPIRRQITIMSMGTNVFISSSFLFDGNMPTDYTNGATVPWSALKQGYAGISNIFSETWGVDGECWTTPLLFEMELEKCEAGFSRLFGYMTLHQAGGGDFNMTVRFYQKGVTVPPDTSTNQIYDAQGNLVYHEGYYTYNPTNPNMLLMQVRLQDTRHALQFVSPNGMGVCIPCPDNWSC